MNETPCEDFIKAPKSIQNYAKGLWFSCFTCDKETLHKYLSMGFYYITGMICDDRVSKEAPRNRSSSRFPCDRLITRDA